jgi:hypothetical protein
MEKAGLIVYALFGLMALAVWVVCAVFLFPFGIFLGIIPAAFLAWGGGMVGTLIRPSTYKKARQRIG